MERISCTRYISKRSRYVRGYTVIELVVVTGIIGVITLIVVLNQRTFNNTILLQNTAADIALSIRNAQTFGISSHATNGVTNAPYGVDFSTSPTSYTFFADTYPGIPANATPASKPGDKLYCSSIAGSCTGIDNIFTQTISLNNKITIGQWCAIGTESSLPVQYCKNSATGVSNGGMMHLALVFSRPNPATNFNVLDASGNKQTGPIFNSACLQIWSEGGISRAVTINRFGQVTVEAPGVPLSCP